MVIYTVEDIKEFIDELKDELDQKLNLEKQSSREVFRYLLNQESMYHRYDVLGCGFTREQWSEVSDAFNKLYKEIDSERYERIKHVIAKLFKWSDMKDNEFTDVREHYSKVTDHDLLILLQM